MSAAAPPIQAILSNKNLVNAAKATENSNANKESIDESFMNPALTDRTITIWILPPNDERTELLKLEAVQKEYQRELEAMQMAFQEMMHDIQCEAKMAQDATEKRNQSLAVQQQSSFLPQFEKTNIIEGIRNKLNANKEIMAEFQSNMQALLKKMNDNKKKFTDNKFLTTAKQALQDQSKLKKEQNVATMLPQLYDTTPPSAAYLEMVKQHNINVETFVKKFSILRNIWIKQKNKLKNTAGQRMIGDIYARLHEPLIISIIADDTENFKKHFNDNVGDIYYLELCCLCGSKNIINGFFLGSEKRKQCLILSENALAYSLSSADEALALFLAQEFKKLGGKDPGPITLYSLGNFTLSEKICAMFPNRNIASFTRS